MKTGCRRAPPGWTRVSVLRLAIRELGGELTLVMALMLGILGDATPARAQQMVQVPRIGVLFSGAPTTSSHAVAAFEQGIRERGYEEGRTVVIERRFGEAKVERMAEIAAELVRSNVDVIVASTDAGIAAVKQRTHTIPIVMVNSTDPVGTGFVASLARPGGNVTGLSTLSPDLSAKRLELLKEAVPALTRVAIIWNPDIRGAVLDHKETEAASRSLHLQLQSIEVRRADDLDRAFSTMKTGRVQGLIVPVVNPLAFANRVEIARLAQQNRVPSIFGGREFAVAGGLMAYGPSIADGWRRAATYVDKILKGAKPGDLPVEQPTTFELVINLKTARSIGIAIPPSLVRRADHLIQ
jgi:putative tryptophan/tyrosine transport system substrate-binding protein